MQMFVIFLLAYLVGSFPTGKILGYFKGIDIQKHGSGNIGFANAVRVLGWPSGVVVLIVDVLKGFVPIYLAINYVSIDGIALLLLGLMPLLGHTFPIWLRFKGGKAIATGLGVLLAIAPLLALCAGIIYVTVMAFLRHPAIGSLAAVWSLPLFAYFLESDLTIYMFVLALFATYTHRSNIKKILANAR